MARMQPPAGHFNPGVYLDVDRAIAYTGDDAATRGLLAMVEARLESDVAAIWRNLDAGDAVSAGRALHVLKGLTPVFCVDSLTEAIANSEALGQTGEIGALKLAFTLLSPQLLALRFEIQTYLATPPDHPKIVTVGLDQPDDETPLET